MNYNNLITGLRVQTQIPLDYKGYVQSEAALVDLGNSDNLAYTYHKGLLFFCKNEGTRYEWKEVITGEENTGLRTNDFIYPPNLIVDGVNYSNKRYNFYPAGKVPNLQEVLEAGNSTTHSILFGDGGPINANIGAYQVLIGNGPDNYTLTSSSLSHNYGLDYSRLTLPLNTGAQATFQTPIKPTGTYTLATTADIPVIPATPGLQEVLNVGKYASVDGGQASVEILGGTPGNRYFEFFANDSSYVESTNLRIYPSYIMLQGYGATNWSQVSLDNGNLLLRKSNLATGISTMINVADPVNPVTITFPAKPTGNYTVAMVEDLPTAPGLQQVLDVNGYAEVDGGDSYVDFFGMGAGARVSGFGVDDGAGRSSAIEINRATFSLDARSPIRYAQVAAQDGVLMLIQQDRTIGATTGFQITPPLVDSTISLPAPAVVGNYTVALVEDLQVVPLELINEGSGSGIIIRGRDAANYASVGLRAVDLSYTATASLITGASGESSFAANEQTFASAYCSFASGLETVASGVGAHSEGVQSRATGYASHAEGSDTLASGTYAHSEGGTTVAGGDYAHVEGLNSEANGNGSHAEGNACYALGENAHAQNYGTLAAGNNSHTGGVESVARSYGETSVGIHGTDQAGSATTIVSTDRLFNIGNGTSSIAKSDALTILKNGLTTLPSTTNAMITAASGKAVVTKEYLAAEIAAVAPSLVVDLHYINSWILDEQYSFATGLAGGKVILSATAFLECTSTTQGYIAGDIIPVPSPERDDAGGIPSQGIGVQFSSATNGVIRVITSSEISIMPAYTGASTGSPIILSTPSAWKLRIVVMSI